MKPEKALTIDDLSRMAARRLPKLVFDAIDGGSGDEVTLRANRSAYERVRFRPRPFADVADRDLSTTVFGERIASPVLLAPTGSARLAGHEAELTVARAAGDVGTVFTYGSVASYTLEDVAGVADGPLWFQLYLPPDRQIAADLVGRVARAGYRALVLTIDTPMRGNRDRDVRNRFTIPVQISPKVIAQGLTRPGWSMQFLMNNAGPKKEAITTGRGEVKNAKRFSLKEVESRIVGAKWQATWDDLRFLRDLWDGPLLVKGLMRTDEIDQLVDVGVDGVIVSNHGGRQLDGVPATIEVLPEIVAAVAGRMEVFVDGGIRRGTDVVKALALGARACFVGRPYIFALAVGGYQGVRRMFDILDDEISRTMALVGVRSLEELDTTFVDVLPPAGTAAR